MASNPEVILAPSAVKVRVVLEPAFNALTSLLCLNLVEAYSGLGDWVVETHRSMSKAQRRRNRIVLGFFYPVVQPQREWASFPDYLDGLRESDFAALRDQQVAALRDGGNGKPDTESGLRRLVDGSKHADEFSGAERKEIVGLLQSPEAMRTYVVSHLKSMWAGHLEPEWRRVRPLLQESITAFGRLEFKGLSAADAVRKVIGRDLRGKESHLAEAHTLLCVPSAHVGPYVTLHKESGLMRIAFGARLPEGLSPETAGSELGRSDLLVRLGALADDTRLQILEMLKREGEMYAQDIINRLALSQSSASRHLIQLSATGFLKERRQERGKCYSLNPDCVARTVSALEGFLT